MENEKSAYYKIRKALENAQRSEYTNGMATEKEKVVTEYGIIEVMRKAGNLEVPENFLLFVRKNHHMGHVEPNLTKISHILEQILGIRKTDLNIVMKEPSNKEETWTCIIPVSLF